MEEMSLNQANPFIFSQDDYLDCYGDPSVIGKIGTDIEENKCGWLVVQALQKVNAEQRQIIEVSTYGEKFSDISPKLQKQINLKH